MLRPRTGSGAERPGSALTVAVAIGTALVILVLGVGLTRLVEESRERAMRAAEQSLERSARVAESLLNRQLLQVDSALATLPSLFEAAGLADTADGARAAGAIMRGLNGQSYAFRDLLLTRPDGSVWAAGRPRTRRQPFLPLREAAGPARGAGATLDGPVRDPRMGDWVLYLSRPVEVPQVGALRAVAEVPIATLMAPLSDIGQSPGVRVLVRWRDGRLIASLPHDELAIGTVVEPAGDAIAERQGVVEIALPSLGPVLAVERASLYPGVEVVLTVERDQALADWARDRDRRAFLGLIGALLILACGAALIAALRRKEQLEAERRRSRRVLEDAIEGMSDGFVMWDADDRLVTCNQNYRELYKESAPFIVPGARFEDVIRKGALAGQYPQAAGDVEGFVQRTVAWHQAASGSLERLLPDGRWLLVTERRTANGGIVGIRTDITPLKHTSAELASANQRFDEALSNMPHGLLMVDASGRVIVCNRTFAQLFGLGEPSALFGLTLEALFAAVEASGSFAGGSAGAIHRRQAAHLSEASPVRFNATAADGRCVEVTQRPMESGGFVAIYEDVTEKQRAERRIAYMAHHDALTELPNRVYFRDELERRVDEIRDGEDEVAVLYLDLDGFKEVNDTLGHPVGDALLAAVARRLRASAEPHGLIARLGGDEFAVAITGRGVSAQAAALGGRLVAAMRAPFEVAGRRLSVGVSVGAAVARSSADDADTLLKRADMALYAAKAGGRGGYVEFEPEMETRLRARLDLRRDVEEALAAKEFELAYQPIFDLSTGGQVGFEALLRWSHRTRGWISPAEFIPLAEETGLILEIGAWALRRAAADASGLPGGFRVAVNVSPVQLRSGTIVDVVADALAQSGLAPDRLELEITESALLGDQEETLATLHKLRGLGVRIVLDDFGTGFSSLSHLRMFPFQKIKIDQLFVRDATAREDCSAIISSVVELANRLGMTTTAEGIETEEQLGLVRRLGCHEGQGYLLGRPAPILAGIARLAEPKALPAPRRVRRVEGRGAARRS
jgi:diguanylate cyclase (GGDEF)-like protein/PAS domain S-box-containing protein